MFPCWYFEYLIVFILLFTHLKILEVLSYSVNCDIKSLSLYFYFLRYYTSKYLYIPINDELYPFFLSFQLTLIEVAHPTVFRILIMFPIIKISFTNNKFLNNSFRLCQNTISWWLLLLRYNWNCFKYFKNSSYR